ncbi:MAG: acyl carrier protein [Gemmatimonadota bacterium]
MSQDDIRGTVLDVLRRVAPDVDVAGLDPAIDLREQADLDSVDILNLVVGLHQALGVDVPETDYDELTSVDRAVSYLASRINEQRG